MDMEPIWVWITFINMGTSTEESALLAIAPFPGLIIQDTNGIRFRVEEVTVHTGASTTVFGATRGLCCTAKRVM